MADKVIPFGNAPLEEKRPHHSCKRSAIAVIFSLLFFGTLFHPVSRSYHPACHAYSRLRPLTVEERVHNVLARTPLIDGHDDFPLLTGLPSHVDLPRLREGQNGGAFWSVYAPCPKNGSDWSDDNYKDIVLFTNQQIDLMTRLSAAYSNDFSHVAGITADSALAAFKQGKLISPLGVEGLHQIGNSVANLRSFHALGVRYATLTHNCGNIFADSALVESPFRKAEPYWGGLSPKGKELIHEFNRIGLIVDLAHVSADTMRDVLGGTEFEGSKAPIMFSHSSAFAICPHPRNVPDDVLQLVKKTNSVVMVNFAPDFISCKDVGNDNGVPVLVPENATLAQVADHITYIGNLIGYDHVGVGSDFDGIPSVPKGLEDVSKYPDLFAELLRRGVSDEDAAKVAGGNILRVWKDVEEVSAKLQADGFPVLEDDLPSLRFQENFKLLGLE
ncbi:membrane dipeptidase [Truncatella angustata]|uniref:Dipeptidase n=1 Tax=Truncatella angustata TaxID=152316 RepID=A0A9P8UFC2_9PEZI|nr:membrane dipeptidase [Truncatella angustata]KAH6648882.1 membrane dipeptidase [Truncatella angustata]